MAATAALAMRGGVSAVPVAAQVVPVEPAVAATAAARRDRNQGSANTVRMAA